MGVEQDVKGRAAIAQPWHRGDDFPLGIAIHTASAELGLAKVIGTACNHQSWALGRDLSSDLQDYLRQFITPHPWTSVAFVAAAIGPGGFTGTRMGVVAAKTLAQQLEIPIFGVCSLAAAVWQRRDRFRVGDWIAVTLPARRGEIHGAVYELGTNGLVCRRSPVVIMPDVWQQELAQLEHPWVDCELPFEMGGDAEGLLAIAGWRWLQGDRPHWSEVLPYYGQHPVHR
ncbi:MAG: tRNA (adenosine(37)-N6)-threonylcarbamoyltransferase complex dimerization subunit type 1 TsaB [Cyanobacteria bacterium P01_H01_bin.130]